MWEVREEKNPRMLRCQFWHLGKARLHWCSWLEQESLLQCFLWKDLRERCTPREMYTKYRQWMSTLHCMASPREKVDGKSEQRKLRERVQKKMCENNQKNSMVFHWKQDGIRHWSKPGVPVAPAVHGCESLHCSATMPGTADTGRAGLKHYPRSLPWPQQFYYPFLSAFILSQSLICCQLPKYNERVLQGGWEE